MAASKHVCYTLPQCSAVSVGHAEARPNELDDSTIALFSLVFHAMFNGLALLVHGQDRLGCPAAINYCFHSIEVRLVSKKNPTTVR